ncbi:MAG: hypothetical protein ACOX5F_10020 [Anaerovoracaceae bacterium]
MKELYIEVGNRRVPLDSEIVEKYGLNQGTKSPFTSQNLVGRNGDSTLLTSQDEKMIKDSFNHMPFKGIEGEGVDQMENGFQMSQSEILDFAQGTDSTVAGEYK